jgi:hypothetical protein
MDKKWYNYFVSTDQPEGSAEEVPPPPPVQGARPPARAAVPRPAGSSAAQAVADIAAAVTIPESRFAAPVNNPTSFDEIYQAAEIPVASHGYTILKVADMLQNEHIRDMAPTVKRSTILVALDAAGVKVQEVIQDAVRRDKALDTYELVQEKSILELENKKNQENRQFQAELDRLKAEYEAKIRKNNDSVAREKERFSQWRVNKQQEEQKIAEAVSYFASPNPITTGRPASPTAGSPASGAPPAKPQGSEP